MTQWITNLVRDLGYIGLAFLTLIENVFPPIPSEIIMPLGGFLVSEGQLTLVGVILAGTLGSVVGGLVLYGVGRVLTQDRLNEWTDRHGKWLLLTPQDIDDAFDWFSHHGKKAVFLARLVPGVRSLISIPAGTCKMELTTFLLYTTLGTAIWSGALAYGGMVLGNQYEQLSRLLRYATYAVIGLIVLAIVWWYIKRRRQKEG